MVFILKIEEEFKIAKQEAIRILNQIIHKKKKGIKPNLDGSILKGIEIYSLKYFDLKRFDYAKELFEVLLRIALEVNDEIWISASLSSLGVMYEKLGETDKALEILYKALKYDFNNKGNILYNIGFILLNHKCDKEESLRKFEEALLETNRSGDRNTEALVLYSIGIIKYTYGLYEEAWNLFSKSLKFCKENKNQEYIGKNLISLALLDKVNGRYDLALEKLKQSLIIYKKMKLSEYIVASLFHIATIYTAKSEYNKSQVYLVGAYRREEKEGDEQGKAHIITEMGKLLRIKGLYTEALKKYDLAIDIYKELNHQQGLSVALCNKGKVFQSKGNFSEALKLYNKALEISERNKDIDNIRANLNNLGALAQEIGKFQEALDHFRKAYEISRSTKNIEGKRTSKNNIGAIYVRLGKYDEALIELKEALKISIEIEKEHGIAIALNNIGAVYQYSKKYNLALSNFNKALKIYEKVEDIENIGKTLNNIGGVYKQLGMDKKAYNYYSKALTIFEETNNLNQQITELYNIGKLYEIWNDFNKAKRFFDKALELAIEIGNKNAESIVYTSLGILNHKRGNHKLAFEQYCKAIDINEILIGEIESEEIRIDYRITKLNPLKLIVGLLIDWNRKNDVSDRENNDFLFEAIKFLEMQKAREISDRLEFRNIAESNLTTELKELLNEERGLVTKINHIYYDKQKTNDCKNSVLSKLTEINLITEKIKKIRMEILNKTYHPAIVKQTSEYNPIKKFREIFDYEKSAIIWYFFYDENLKPNTINLFIWTKKSIRIFTLDDFSLDALIDEVNQFYNLQKKHSNGASEILEKISIKLGEKLTDEIWQTLEDKKLLIIIPYEKLNKLPWGIIEKISEKRREKIYENFSEYLGLKLPIVYSHNLSLLISCIKREIRRENKFLFIANPNFNITELNLIEANKEVKSILNLVSQSNTKKENVVLLQNEKALKRKFLEELKRNFTVIHFAGHSTYVVDDPWMSHLKFHSYEGEDRLSLTEISQIKLDSTPLFILSSCESMKGTFKQGGEFLGFIRILLLSGVTTIIGSNWLLDDSIAPYFMKIFYKEYIRGKNAAAAMHKAKIILYKELGFTRPIDWGVYDLFGNPFIRLF